MKRKKCRPQGRFGLESLLQNMFCNLRYNKAGFFSQSRKVEGIFKLILSIGQVNRNEPIF